MQEETTQKTISVCIKGGKISADVLKSALRYLLKEISKEQSKAKSKKAAIPHGKQTLKDHDDSRY